MTSLVRTLCCCNGQDSDDEHALIGDGDHADVISARNGPTGEAINRLWSSGTGQNSAQGTPLIRNHHQCDEEDELLNQILESTQQNIIDVSNIEGGLIQSSEDITKSQRYEDAIRQHDARIRRQTNQANSPNDTEATTSSSSRNGLVLLDIGVHVADLLGRPPPSPVFVSKAREFTKMVSDAVVNGIKVEHKQDILVQMSFGDE